MNEPSKPALPLFWLVLLAAAGTMALTRLSQPLGLACP